MRDFLLAPFLSLFSRNFYRRLLVWPLSRGFLYLVYLSLLLTLSSWLTFRILFLPVANELATWLGERLPEIIITREGIRMGIEDPLLLSHPRWGPLVYLDPNRDAPPQEDFKKAFVILTRTEVAYRYPADGEIQTRSVIPRGDQKGWRDRTLRGDDITKLWRNVRPFVTIIFFLFGLVGFYLWKLIAGLFYSLVALFLNRFRKERLSYAALLNLTLFALTPVSLYQFAAAQLPAWKIPLHFPIAFVITSLYLAYGILGTRERSTSEGQVL